MSKPALANKSQQHRAVRLNCGWARGPHSLGRGQRRRRHVLAQPMALWVPRARADSLLLPRRAPQVLWGIGALMLGCVVVRTSFGHASLIS